ncbi:hypothetical protein DCS32_15310 [Dokdonia sp. Dokd-P16]|nr:hypothetical protein DCS32_15310 [Dokdonia sp. Dokd-P16]
MKRFEIYKNIRKRAIIFGLPISLFALMMVSILASLLVIIFSFSFPTVIGAMFLNAALYIALGRVNSKPHLFQIGNSFPLIISNKKNSTIDYEED